MNCAVSGSWKREWDRLVRKAAVNRKGTAPGGYEIYAHAGFWAYVRDQADMRHSSWNNHLLKRNATLATIQKAKAESSATDVWDDTTWLVVVPPNQRPVGKVYNSQKWDLPRFLDYSCSPKTCECK
jgi:hypothetical protein